MAMETLRNKVINDPEFKEFLQQKPSLSEASIDSYIVALVRFIDFTKEPFYKTIYELRDLQNDRIEDNVIIRFNPNHSKVKMLQYGFIDYLRECGSSEVTVNSYIRRLRAIFTTCGIILPKYPDLNPVPKEWYLLSKDEIKYVLDCSNVHFGATVNFLAVTGLRLRDVCNLTIKDFMIATEEYHDCKELEDFLASAPEGMMGYWELKPNKTKKLNIKCKVCNTPESSNLILLSLNERVKFLDNYNKENGTNLKLTKNDPLFGNRRYQYKKPLAPKSLGTQLGRQKHKIYAEKKRVLKYQYDKGQISKETYEEAIETMPNFHAHGLRKFFITTLAKNRVDVRISALMEGHSAPIQTDGHYINDDYLMNAVKDEYLRCIQDFSFEKVEVRFLTSKEKEEHEKTIAILKDKYEKLEADIPKIVEEEFDKKAHLIFKYIDDAPKKIN